MSAYAELSAQLRDPMREWWQTRGVWLLAGMVAYTTILLILRLYLISRVSGYLPNYLWLITEVTWLLAAAEVVRTLPADHWQINAANPFRSRYLPAFLLCVAQGLLPIVVYLFLRWSYSWSLDAIQYPIAPLSELGLHDLSHSFPWLLDLLLDMWLPLLLLVYLRDARLGFGLLCTYWIAGRLWQVSDLVTYSSGGGSHLSVDQLKASVPGFLFLLLCTIIFFRLAWKLGRPWRQIAIGWLVVGGGILLLDYLPDNLWADSHRVYWPWPVSVLVSLTVYFTLVHGLARQKQLQWQAAYWVLVGAFLVRPIAWSVYFRYADWALPVFDLSHACTELYRYPLPSSGRIAELWSSAWPLDKTILGLLTPAAPLVWWLIWYGVFFGGMAWILSTSSTRAGGEPELPHPQLQLSTEPQG